MKITSLRELNKQGKYTADQLLSWKKFEGMYLNTYACHFDFWVDGKGYETVYEVRDMTDEIRENYESVRDILNRV